MYTPPRSPTTSRSLESSLTTPTPQRMSHPVDISDRDDWARMSLNAYDKVPGRGRMIPQSNTDPDVVGIALSDAIAGKYKRLNGRDDRLFQACGPSISIRINWAGCYPLWSRQIPTRDFKNPPGPVTRSKVAKNVARSVQRFIDEMNFKPLEEDADPAWAVGRSRNGILLGDLALVRLEHVSKGSWQAYLCLASSAISKGPLGD